MMRARTLASSVVLTFSIAEMVSLAGCDATKDPVADGPTHNPPAPDAKPKLAKAPEPDNENPPAPRDPEPPEPSHDNPPSPTLDVPPAAAKAAPNPKEVDPFVFPANQLKGKGKTTMLQANGTCITVKDDTCKAGKHCNPPKPKAVKCPAALRLPAASAKGEVYTRGDQTCWERGDEASTRIVCPAKSK